MLIAEPVALFLRPRLDSPFSRYTTLTSPPPVGVYKGQQGMADEETDTPNSIDRASKFKKKRGPGR